MKDLWVYYDVEWTFLTMLCGSVPMNEELIPAWLAARQPSVKPPSGKSLQEVQQEVYDTMMDQPTDAEVTEEMTKRVTNGFQQIDGHLVVRASTIRAHLKDCARIVEKSVIGKVKGEMSFRQKVANGIMVIGDGIVNGTEFVPILTPEKKQITIPTGFVDQPIHVMTPRGPINALKRFFYVFPARLNFSLRCLPFLHKMDLETLMQYGGFHGYAGERGNQNGQYQFTLTKKEDEHAR